MGKFDDHFSQAEIVLSHLGINIGIAVAEKSPPFGMPTKNVFASNALHHTSSNTSREGSLILIVHLLRSDGDSTLADDILNLRNEGEGGEENDFGTSICFFDSASVFHFVEKGDEAIGEVESVGFCGWVHLGANTSVIFVSKFDGNHTKCAVWIDFIRMKNSANAR